MARIRSIKPEFWRSPSTAKASPRARLLYIAMWNWADDYGVGEWTVRELLGFAFPNDSDVNNAELQSLCTEVATCFDTVFYIVRGRRFYCIPAWDEHQKNERRAQGKYPRPDSPEAYLDPVFIGITEKRGTSVQTSGDTASGTGEQGTGEQGTGNRGMARIEPTVNLVSLFDDAYEHWPKKVKREEAFEKFKIASRIQTASHLSMDIIRFGDAYRETTVKQFIPALGVWLNQKRWTDDLPTAPEAETRKATRGDQNLAFVANLARQQSNPREIEA